MCAYIVGIPPFRPTEKCPGRTNKGKQSFYTKIQAGESGEKGK
jgi:hypothetical protein